MTFKPYCYEMWLEYMEECLSYNTMASPYRDWIKQNRWYLRKTYRLRYGKLKQPWQPDYERVISPNQ